MSLKEVMEAEGRKQTWLAQVIGVDRSQVSKYVNGLMPPEPTRAAIAEALNRETGELWPDTTASAA